MKIRTTRKHFILLAVLSATGRPIDEIGPGGTAVVKPAQDPAAAASRDAVRPGSPAALAVEREGSVIGSYKLLERIGEGGMAVVCMAEQERAARRTCLDDSGRFLSVSFFLRSQSHFP